MAGKLIFFLHLCLLIIFVGFIGAEDYMTSHGCKYKAAVYEHFALSSLIPSINRSEAVKIMHINLDTYEEQVKNAALKGSKIIVFPEYGITGFFIAGTRDSILPFLEVVPNTTQPLVNPCTQEEYKDRPIQSRISCLAKEHSIIMVVNLASMQPCDETDPHCPKDGRYQFNTALAYGTDGNLLAIYHKSNLYAAETYMFDSGSRSSIATGVFTTNFGTFSLFICFDILFDYPAEYFEKFNINSVAFPTAWMNELPLLSAIEYQQAWALGMNMNLLASNQHLPFEQMTGSGLYSAGEGAVTYHYDMKTYKGKLLIADLPCFPSNATSNKFKEHVSRSMSRDKANALSSFGIGNISKSEEETSRFVFECRNETFLNLKTVARKKEKMQMLINDTNDFEKDQKTFISLVNNDPYTLKLLTTTSGFVTVTDNDVTCTLNYTVDDAWQQNDWYALGTFSGLHTKNGKYFIQACILLRCASEQKSKCGAETSDAHTHFKDFSLQMKGYASQTFLTPEMLSDGVGLPKRRLAWDTNKTFDQLWSHQGALKDPLLMAGVYGRLYACD